MDFSLDACSNIFCTSIYAATAIIKNLIDNPKAESKRKLLLISKDIKSNTINSIY